MGAQMGGSYSNLGGDPATQALNAAMGGSNSNLAVDMSVDGPPTQAMDMQQWGGGMSSMPMSSGGIMNNMGGSMNNMSNIMLQGGQPQVQEQEPSQQGLQAQQAAKLMQIKQAQQILQMQAQLIERQQQQQQQQQGGGSPSSSSGGSRQVPDNPKFYAGIFNNLQAQGANGSSNDDNSAMLRQLQELMNSSLGESISSLGSGAPPSQHHHHHQQQGFMSSSPHHGGDTSMMQSHSGGGMGHMEMSDEVTQPITDNIFDEVVTNDELLRMLGSGGGGGADDDVGDESDAQLRELLRTFDVSNLDSLEFDFGDSSR